MTTLYIVGGGGFGVEVQLTAIAMLATGQTAFDQFVFLDDTGEYLRKRGLDHLCAGTIKDHAIDPHGVYCIAIGDPVVRKALSVALSDRGANFASLIHPSAIVSPFAIIGEGAVIQAHSCIMPFVTIGSHVHVNALSTVGHDSVIGAYTTLSGHVDITGHCSVGHECFFGSGARTVPGVRVGEGSRIGAGVVVQRHIKAHTTLYVSPAKSMISAKRQEKC